MSDNVPGRAPWSTAGTRGSRETVSVQDNPDMVTVSETMDDDLGAGESQSLNIFAPEGSNYRVVAMRLRADGPPEATQGYHRFSLRPMGAFFTVTGQSTFDERLFWVRSHWYDANDGQDPPESTAQQLALQSLRASSEKRLSVLYQNQTDAVQTNTREFDFIMERVSY